MKRAKRESNDLDKPYTTTKRAVIKLAEEQANKYYEEKEAELLERINKGISITCGYLLASTLEEAYGFGKKRSGKAITNFMEDLCFMGDGKTKIEDHIEYWNNKGLKIYEKGNELVVKVD